MAREIKFRVWDGVDYMSKPFTLQDIQSGKVQFTSDAVVMQFTGLLDKNGKEIYESDIVAKWDGTKGQVFFDKSHCGFSVSYPDYYVGLGTDEQIEVVGNTYQHPELLESEKEKA